MDNEMIPILADEIAIRQPASHSRQSRIDWGVALVFAAFAMGYIVLSAWAMLTGRI